MISIKKKMMVGVLIILAGGFMARTAFSEEKLTSSARLGVVLPLVGDLEDIADTGFALGAQTMHRVSANDSYGVDIGYFSFGEDSEEQVDTTVSIISMIGLRRHEMSPRGDTKPFIETGFGFARTQINIADSNAGGAAVTRGTNEEDISPTIMLGLGFDRPISNGAAFGMSLNYQHFFFKVGDVNGGGSFSLLAHLRI